MTSAAPSFPSGRELAGLVRSLPQFPEAALWVGHLTIHRLEVPVLVQETVPLAGVEKGILLALDSFGPSTLGRLQELLGLPQALLRNALGHLHRCGLVELQQDRWMLQSSVPCPADQPEAVVQRVCRREFFLLDHPDGCFRYVAWRAGTGPGREATPTRLPDPAVVQEWLEAPSPWKARHGFPSDVVGLVRPKDPAIPEEVCPGWKRIALHRAETYAVCILRLADRLTAHVVHPTTWTCAEATPALRMEDAEAIQETFGDLLAEPGQEQWHAAWRHWCTEHAIPLAEAPGVQFQRRGTTLHISGHPLRPERLRSLAASPDQSEHWLLAGSCGLRCAARIEFGLARLGRGQR